MPWCRWLWRAAAAEIGAAGAATPLPPSQSPANSQLFKSYTIIPAVRSRKLAARNNATVRNRSRMWCDLPTLDNLFYYFFILPGFISAVKLDTELCDRISEPFDFDFGELLFGIYALLKLESKSRKFELLTTNVNIWYIKKCEE